MWSEQGRKMCVGVGDFISPRRKVCLAELSRLERLCVVGGFAVFWRENAVGSMLWFPERLGGLGKK